MPALDARPRGSECAERADSRSVRTDQGAGDIVVQSESGIESTLFTDDLVHIHIYTITTLVSHHLTNQVVLPLHLHGTPPVLADRVNRLGHLVILELGR